MPVWHPDGRSAPGVPFDAPSTVSEEKNGPAPQPPANRRCRAPSHSPCHRAITRPQPRPVRNRAAAVLDRSLTTVPGNDGTPPHPTLELLRICSVTAVSDCRPARGAHGQPVRASGGQRRRPAGGRRSDHAGASGRGADLVGHRPRRLPHWTSRKPASARGCPVHGKPFPGTSTWLIPTRSSRPTARRRTGPAAAPASTNPASPGRARRTGTAGQEDHPRRRRPHRRPLDMAHPRRRRPRAHQAAHNVGNPPSPARTYQEHHSNAAHRTRTRQAADPEP